MSTRDSLLALQAKKAKSVEIQGKPFYIRLLTVGEFLNLRQSVKANPGAEDKHLTQLLLLALADSEGNRLLKDEDSNLVTGLSPEVALLLQDEIMLLNNMMPGDPSKNS